MFKKLDLSVVVISSMLALSGCGGDSPSSSSSGSSSSGTGSSSGSSSSSSTSGGSSSGGSSTSASSTSGNLNAGGFGGSSSGSSVLPPPKDNGSAVEADVTEFYFSYDESASTASRDLTLAAIQNDGFVNASWGRTYEFLNAESFSHFNSEELFPFDIPKAFRN